MPCGLRFAVYVLLSGIVAGGLGGFLYHLTEPALGREGNLVYGFVVAIVLFFPALLGAAPPAIVVGALLWLGGNRRAWVRRKRAWAVTGALTGAIYHLHIAPEDMPYFASAIGAAAVAGAAAALIFRHWMKLLIRLWPGAQEG